MRTINIEFFGPVNFYLGMGAMVLTSIILGGLIGFERESKHKSAGIRTNILICLGATLYTAISLTWYQPGISNFDPNRIAAQIVSGIGFLGAGAIIQSRGSVYGLTSAATIWVVAAVGMTVGQGFPFVATFFTLTALGVLRALNPVYQMIHRENTYHIQIHAAHSVKRNVLKVLQRNDYDFTNLVESSKTVDGREICIVNLDITLHPKELRPFISGLRAFEPIKNVSSHLLIKTA